MGWLRRLHRTFLGSTRDKEFDEELRFHLDQRTEEDAHRGLPLQEARRLAQRRFGNMTLTEEQARDVDTLGWLRDFGRDLRYAARALRRTPAFAAAAVLTFALGVGANATIFSVVYGVLLRPLPYRNADRLVIVQSRSRMSGRVGGAFSGPDLQDFTARTTAFESLALCSNSIFALDTDNGNETITGANVSERFFPMLAVPMAVGRPLTDSHAREIVISERLWRQAFGRDRRVIGRHVRVNAEPYTIVGVARNDVKLPMETLMSVGAPAQAPDLWAPMEFAPRVNDRRSRYYQLVARLKQGVSFSQARAVGDATARAIWADFDPGGREDYVPVVTPLHDALTGGVRPALFLLLGAVGLVLLVACSNVTNLLLARQSARSHELAVRVSLGAPRHRLVIQLLAEASVLAFVGGIVGVTIAGAAVAVLQRLEPAGLPRLDAVRVDLPVLLFALAVSSAAALLSSAVPLVQLARSNAPSGLRPGAGKQTAGKRMRRVRSALVVSELAVSLTLLVGAVLLARSFVNLLRTDVGASVDHVVAVELNLAMGRTLPAARQVALADQIVERVRALPGVRDAGVANALPPHRSRMNYSFETTDLSFGRPGSRQLNMVNPTSGYFAALAVPLVRGRLFSAADGLTSPQAAIVSAGAARYLFGTLDVVGRSLPGLRGGQMPIVGVVGDVKYGGLGVAPPQTVYVPFAQYPFKNMMLVARTSGDPRALAGSLKQVIHAVDREITTGLPRPLDDEISDAVAQPRFRTASLSAIAGLALLLAAIGLYGVVAYSVTQRTGEIGVRMALGATDSRVVGMVLREALTLAAAGAVIGLACAYALTRTLQSLLYGVTPADGVSFLIAAVSLILMTVAASYFPARRATQVDPIVALRSE